MDFVALATSPNAPATARRHVRVECAAHGVSASMTDTAVLLTSEIVTNAVLHGGGDMRLGASALATHVRVEVMDGSRQHPTLRRLALAADGMALPADESTTLLAEGGRGIALVNSLADHWGAVDAQPGKCVWFELGASPFIPQEAPLIGAIPAHDAPAA
ncbi:MAG TPA: ATP-binding protein [Mycobacteriales bacterium]|nr:ATP-binding protein [Mycobacteriales bacterium]